MLLRYYGHYTDPDALTDEQWAMAVKQIEHIRKAEQK
jgi:hypothetical protein